jgi:hypothetical protein
VYLFIKHNRSQFLLWRETYTRRKTGVGGEYKNKPRRRRRVLPNIHSKLPIWDSKTSTIKHPVLLFEGRNHRFIEADEVTTRADGGRPIFAASIGSRTIKTDPVRLPAKQKDGSYKLVATYTPRTVKAFQRKSALSGLSGESARMTCSAKRPDRSRSLDQYASGHRRTRKVFKSWKTMRHRGGVSHDLFMQTSERAILYFPDTGKVTCKGVDLAKAVCDSQNVNQRNQEQESVGVRWYRKDGAREFEVRVLPRTRCDNSRESALIDGHKCGEVERWTLSPAS